MALQTYGNLRQQVLRRDGWRCQSRGTMSNLEIHHRQFRSHAGDDAEENLILRFRGKSCLQNMRL
jgi:5-methylcytosine-specific restriction endonuclease McrA